MYSTFSASPVTSEKSLVTTNTFNQPRKKGRRERPVIHQIFEDASRETQDIFWVNSLRDAARGIFPNKKFSYNHRRLIFYTKRKASSVEIPNDPREAFKIFYEFVHFHSPIRSENDIQAIKIDSANNYRSNVKTLNNKDIWQLLQQFVTNFSNYYQLTPNARKSLESSVCLGYRLGIFDCKSVEIKNGIIVNLPGLIYDNYNDICFINRDTLIEARNRFASETRDEEKINPGLIQHQAYEPRGKNLNEDWKKIIKALNLVGPRPNEGNYSEIF